MGDFNCYGPLLRNAAFARRPKLDSSPLDPLPSPALSLSLSHSSFIVLIRYSSSSCGACSVHKIPPTMIPINHGSHASISPISTALMPSDKNSALIRYGFLFLSIRSIYPVDSYLLKDSEFFYEPYLVQTINV